MTSLASTTKMIGSAMPYLGSGIRKSRNGDPKGGDNVRLRDRPQRITNIFRSCETAQWPGFVMGDHRDVKAKNFEILVLVLVIDRFQIRGIFAPTGGRALRVSYWVGADAAAAGSVGAQTSRKKRFLNQEFKG